MPTYTTTDEVSVNGTVLNTYAYNIETIGSRAKATGIRGGNQERTFGRGDLWVPKEYGPRIETWGMWVIGGNADGSALGAGQTSTRGVFYENMEALMSLFFGRPNQMLSLSRKRIRADGSVLEVIAQGEAISMTDPTTMAGGTRAVFTVDVVIPGGVWLATSATTITSAGAITNPGTALSLVDSLTMSGTLTNSAGESIVVTGAPVTLYPKTLGISSAARWVDVKYTGRHMLTIPPGASTLTGAGLTSLTYTPAYM